MSSFGLKILACIGMLIDHIGYCLFPQLIFLRYIGRIAFPIFAFQISVGFDKTSNQEKYIIRMLLFTLLSQIPFDIFRVVSDGVPLTPLLNVGATLTLGLLSLYCLKNVKNLWLKLTFIAAILALSTIIPMDYGWYGISIILVFYLFRKDKFFQGIAFSIILLIYCSYRKSFFSLPAIFALLPILLYNGQKGKSSQHLFYYFYPIHFLFLAIIKWVWLGNSVLP